VKKRGISLTRKKRTQKCMKKLRKKMTRGRKRTTTGKGREEKEQE
jgi:hypothetical protein